MIGKKNVSGDLEPVSLEIDSKKGYVIIFKCKKCGKIRKNKAAKDDNMDLLIDLSNKQIRWFCRHIVTIHII